MGDAYDRLINSGVVAVLRDIDPDVFLDVVQALRAGGVTAFEVTVDVRNATELITSVTEAYEDDDDVVVGAGSVLDDAAAQSAIEAGAEFVVGPTLAPDMVETANRYDVLTAPGVMTPTEAIRAAEAGADLIKVFPASTVGPGHLRAIQGPLGDLPLMPTGGVGSENVASFFEAGASVVGAGSALIDYDAVGREDFDAVETRAAAFVESVKDARS